MVRRLLRFQQGLKRVFSARCNIYISRLCYDASVRLSVRQSVCDVCALWSHGAMDHGYLCMLG